jgi:hypothetical protein
LVVNVLAADSSSGREAVNSWVWAENVGRREERLARWVEEAMTALCDRLESACRLRRCDDADWRRDAGSEVVRSGKESVLRRERYAEASRAAGGGEASSK